MFRRKKSDVSRKIVFLGKTKNMLIGIDERDRLPHSILKSYGWKSRKKGNQLTSKIRFLTDIFISFEYFQKQKKYAHGKLQELSNLLRYSESTNDTIPCKENKIVALPRIKKQQKTKKEGQLLTKWGISRGFWNKTG